MTPDVMDLEAFTSCLKMRCVCVQYRLNIFKAAFLSLLRNFRAHKICFVMKGPPKAVGCTFTTQ